MERILVIGKNFTTSEKIRHTLELKDFLVTICLNNATAEIETEKESFFASVIAMDQSDATWDKTVNFVNQHKIPSIIYSSCKYTMELREKLQAKNLLDFIYRDSSRSLETLVNMIERLRLNSQLKVLLVDDSRTARKAGRFILEQTKFQIFEAEDGLEALDILKNNQDISIVISDYEMPKLNGYELVEKIREQFDKNSLAIIGVSHPSTSASTSKFLKYGANDFISKPYTSEEFYCRIITQAELLEFYNKVKSLNEQKNYIMAMVAHDIRGPLGNIEIVCNRLLNKSKDEFSKNIGKALKAFAGSSSKMMLLLNDLLDISSIESGKSNLYISKNSLQNLVKDRLNLFFNSSAEKKRIKIVFKHDNISDILFDLRRITQVIDNLISNAIKFTPLDGEVIINLKQKKKTLVFRIWDTGPGLNTQDMKNVFTEFQKLSASPTGGESSTGLGLAICKKIITLHGGHIGVESEPGLGAEFYFSIPLDRA